MKQWLTSGGNGDTVSVTVGLPDDPVLIEQDYEMVPVDRITTHPDNARRGNIEVIRESIRTNGFYGACVVQRSTGRILVGNHRYLAAVEEGLVEVPVVWVDKSDDEARRLLLVDNRTTDLAVYDDQALVELLSNYADDNGGLVGTGWDDAELAALLAAIEPPQVVVDVDVPPLPTEAVTKVGDLILLGEHRLVCGDSFDSAVLDEAVAGLPVGCVLADPPYGINLDTDYSQEGQASGRRYRSVHGDDRPFDAAQFVTRFDDVREQFWWGADYYRGTIPEGDLSGSWLVWDKRVDESLDAVLGAAFELCWSRQRHQRRILRHAWTNYTSHDNEGHARAHPTEKPVRVLADILGRWAPDGCRVVDPFAGSGTTLIAAEQTGRSSSSVEIDPAYCDVIVERWEKLTGESAQRP
jgi:DNA modification methylase